LTGWYSFSYAAFFFLIENGYRLILRLRHLGSFFATGPSFSPRDGPFVLAPQCFCFLDFPFFFAQTRLSPFRNSVSGLSVPAADTEILLPPSAFFFFFHEPSECLCFNLFVLPLRFLSLFQALLFFSLCLVHSPSFVSASPRRFNIPQFPSQWTLHPFSPPPCASFSPPPVFLVAYFPNPPHACLSVLVNFFFFFFFLPLVVWRTRVVHPPSS